MSGPESDRMGVRDFRVLLVLSEILYGVLGDLYLCRIGGQVCFVEMKEGFSAPGLYSLSRPIASVDAGGSEEWGPEVRKTAN